MKTCASSANWDVAKQQSKAEGERGGAAAGANETGIGGCQAQPSVQFGAGSKHRSGHALVEEQVGPLHQHLLLADEEHLAVVKAHPPAPHHQSRRC